MDLRVQNPFKITKGNVQGIIFVIKIVAGGYTVAVYRGPLSLHLFHSFADLLPSIVEQGCLQGSMFVCVSLSGLGQWPLWSVHIDPEEACIPLKLQLRDKLLLCGMPNTYLCRHPSGLFARWRIESQSVSKRRDNGGIEIRRAKKPEREREDVDRERDIYIYTHTYIEREH